MLFCDFQHKLRKCNNRFHIDVDRQASSNGFEDFPVAGLYYKDMHNNAKYLFGIPHNVVPEYTIAAIDFDELVKFNRFDEIREINNSGLAISKEKLLWRGWRAIVCNLIRMGLIDKSKANKIFNTHFDLNIMQYPRNYINRSF